MYYLVQLTHLFTCNKLSEILTAKLQTRKKQKDFKLLVLKKIIAAYLKGFSK